MASKTFEQFKGLKVQRNSMTSEAGSLEEADNVTLIYDDLITKRRGYTQQAKFATGQQIKHQFAYGDNNFVVSQNRLYRLYRTATTAVADCTNASPTITVTKTSHGLTTGDFICQFAVADTQQTFYAAFPNRHADFYGTFEVTVVDPNTFTIQALASATNTVTTAAGTASYVYYERVGGATISAANLTPRSINENKNAYFTTDNGIVKLERDDLPSLMSGIPQGLDMDGELGKDSSNGFTGFFSRSAQIAYRIVFGRRDANQNLVIGAPSEFLTFVNSKVSSTALSYSSPDLTITYAGHNLSVGDIVTIYDDNDITPAIPDGTEYFVKNIVDTDNFDIELGAGYALGGSPSLNFTYAYTPKIWASIPSEILSVEYLVQVYRTVMSATEAVEPDQDYKLVTEVNLTAAQVASGVFDYLDELPEALITSAPELYTNADQEGEAQANYRPPFCTDIETFANYTFYAAIKYPQQLELNVIAPNNVSNGTTVTINGITYAFRKNASDNLAVVNEITTSTYTGAGATVTVTQASHGFSNNDVIYLFTDTSNTITAGEYTVTVTGANTFTFSFAGAPASGSIVYEGRKNGTAQFLVKAWQFGNGITGGTTVAEAIASMAKSLVKAINRNTNSGLYAQYISGQDDAPGQMLLQAKSLSTAAFAATISTASPDGEAFFPNLPATGTTVQSTQTDSPNVLSISKTNEPEAVPLLNQISVGSEDAAILRIKALRDSLMIVKEDGVYRINGDNPLNFTVIAIDNTVICKAENSVATLNNAVYCLSNQGVVQINENSVQVVSRDIEPLFSSILSNPNLSTATYGFGYESDRHYILATLKPNTSSTTANVVRVFNYLTQAWTNWDATFFTGVLDSSSDSSYLTTTAKNVINKERKTQQKTDFTGQEFGVPAYKGKVSYVDTNNGSASCTVTTLVAHGLSVGDIITVADVSSVVGTVFAGGVGDVEGLREVATVIDATNFTFTADSNATGSVFDERIEYGDWISEYQATADATIGSATVTITTTVAHQLNTGNSVNVDDASGLSTAFPTATNISGFRTVTVTSPTTFTITANALAAATQNGTLTITDGRQEYYYVTLKTPATLSPEVGDAIVYNEQLYKILDVYVYSTTRYLVRINFQALFFSDDATFLYSSYSSKVKFSPIHMGDSGKLKYISMFQTQFRQSGNCTNLRVDFACDSKTTTSPVVWKDAVGTGEAQTVFLGWGEIAWGDEPWGGGESINRTYTTGPAVILRTLVPLDAFTSTFIQPILTHNVAGEEMNIQAIAFDYEMVSTNTTR